MSEANGHHTAYRETLPDSLTGIRVQLAWLGTVRTGQVVEDTPEGPASLWWAEVGYRSAGGHKTEESALRALWAKVGPLVASRMAAMPRPTPEEILRRGEPAARAIEKAASNPVAAVPAQPPPHLMWAVLVRVPGDPGGESADTGQRVIAKTEEEAMEKAGTLCNTGRVAVRAVAVTESLP